MARFSKGFAAAAVILFFLEQSQANVILNRQGFALICPRPILDGVVLEGFSSPVPLRQPMNDSPGSQVPLRFVRGQAHSTNSNLH